MQIIMPFKPKAQLLLQLGEQLIKSENIAVVELVKNSYDADATRVTVTMNDIDDASSGSIEIIDNGTGMSLSTVCDIWMEPGNTYKKDLVSAGRLSPGGRLPIGEKGIGRFGIHKLGKKIEMITRAANCKEVYVKIDWTIFETSDYLDEVNIIIEERTPELFIGDKTGTSLLVTDLSVCWTRGMLREVHRAITALCSPFSYDKNGFHVRLKTNKSDWLEGLMSFKDIKELALYSGSMEINGCNITKFTYHFRPFSIMAGLEQRDYEITAPIKMPIDGKTEESRPRKHKQSSTKDDVIDISGYAIGPVKIDLWVFDRDSSFRARFIADKKSYGDYLNSNGGIRVYRDNIRVYNYGEPNTDWLGLDISRVNSPARFLSNNIVIGAVRIERARSTDLIEKANREGFIENAAFNTFRQAVSFAVETFTHQRNIDKESLRVYLKGGHKEPVVEDISAIRRKIAIYISNPKERDEIDTYLKNIESDFDFIKEMYIKTANAGMSYGAVIHEIEKIIGELSYAVKKENPSYHIKQLTRHLSQLVDNYAELL
jgi:hypothetical protein